MKVVIPEIGLTIVIDVAAWIEKFGLPSPPLASELDDDEALDPAQTSIEDFSQPAPIPWYVDDRPDTSMHFTYYDKNRKGEMRCSRCGKAGYNIRTCDRHQDL